MIRRSGMWAVGFAGALGLALGCSSQKGEASGPTPSNESSGGIATTGGRAASGGSAGSSGGALVTGGVAMTGGVATTGGRNATGGATPSGGTPGTSAGAAGEGGVGGDEPGATDVGQCREVSRFRYATGDQSFSGLALWPMSDGFVLDDGEFSETPFWILGEAGASRAVPRDLAAENPSVVPEKWFVAGTTDDPRFLNIRRIKDPDVGVNTGHFSVQSFLENGEATGPERQVLEIYIRGTSLNQFAVSNDGERVALANVDPVIRDPWMVLVNKDGEPLSDEVRVLDTGDQAVINCFGVRGTAHGAVGFAQDSSSDRFRIVELDATGAVVQDLELEDTESCPNVSVDASGIYVFLRATPESALPDVYRLEGSVLTKLMTMPGDDTSDYISWVAGGPQPLFMRRSGQEFSFERWKDERLVPLSGTFSGELEGWPSDERLFFATFEDHAVTLVEVTCGLAP